MQLSSPAQSKSSFGKARGRARLGQVRRLATAGVVHCKDSPPSRPLGSTHDGLRHSQRQDQRLLQAKTTSSTPRATANAKGRNRCCSSWLLFSLENPLDPSWSLALFPISSPVGSLQPVCSSALPLLPCYSLPVSLWAQSPCAPSTTLTMEGSAKGRLSPQWTLPESGDARHRVVVYRY